MSRVAPQSPERRGVEMRNRFSFRQRAQYRLDNLITRSPFSQILALAVISGLIVVIGTLTIAMSPAERMGLSPGQDTLLHRVWWSFTRLMDPGTFVGDTGSLLVAITGITVTLGGILVFSLLIGILSSKIGEKLDELKQGKSPVIEEEHTIILGSGEKLPSVVRELIEANANLSRGVVAILSEVDKEDMEQSLVDRIDDMKTTFVVCRTGIPTDIDELRKVNVREARSLIVLADEGEDSDVNTVKTLLAVANLSASRSAPLHVVCEMTDRRYGSIAEAAYPGLKWIPAREIVVRLMVQIARQNGLSAVYSELLSFRGNELYLIDASPAHGMTFSEVVHRVEEGIALGLVGPDGVEINPPADRVISKKESLIVLTADDDTCRIDPSLEVDLPAVESALEHQDARPEKTLVLGLNRDVPFMLRQLDSYLPEGSQVVVAGHLPASAWERTISERPPGPFRNISFRYETVDRTSMSGLEAIDPLGFDHIVVLSRQGEGLGGEAADAECIVCLLVLRQIREKAGHSGKGSSSSIVSEIRDPRNKRLASVARVNDFIVSNEIISMILAQVSEEPWLLDIYSELFDPRGCEIYLRDSSLYLIPGRPSSFRAVMQAAHLRNELALGYRVAALHMDLDRNFGITLNPRKDEPLELCAADQIVVIARD